MSQSKVLLLCTAIAVGSVVFVEIIKQIVKAVAKKKGKTLDMKKAEYLLILMPIILTGTGVYLFLKFYTEISLYDTIKLCFIYATSTQTIYTFVIQLSRKGFVGAIHLIKHIFSKTSPKKTIDENAKIVIEEMKKPQEEPKPKTKPKKDDELEDFLKTIGD